MNVKIAMEYMLFELRKVESLLKEKNNGND